MSAFDYDNSFDDDWDERNELEWSEGDWQKYLRKQDQEVERFLSLYENLPPSPDRLDEAARLMGWEAPSQADTALQNGQLSNVLAFDSEEDTEDNEDTLPPYTVHQHPVYIVTQAFHNYLSKKWEGYCHRNTAITPTIAWKLSQSLSGWQRHCLLGLQALDMGDFALTICHFKHTLQHFNLTLSALNLLPEDVGDELFNHFIQNSKMLLFDLREVWLRVINDCREEIRRQLENRD